MLNKNDFLKYASKLAFPIMIQNLIGTLENIADTVMLGYVSQTAMSASSLANQYTFILFCLYYGMATGASVLCAQYWGKGDKKTVERILGLAERISLIVSLVFFVISFSMPTTIMKIFTSSPDTIAAGSEYLRMISFSFMFMGFSQVFMSALRSIGKIMLHSVTNIVSLCVNVICNATFIFGLFGFPKLGVTGAAIATVTAQFIVMSIMIICVIKQKKENVLKGTHLLAKIPAPYLNGICRIGIPTAIQGMAYCIISMVLTRMVSAFGAEAVATQRVGGQIESVSWNTADGFASALNSFTAQNYGAGKMNRVRKGYRASLWTIGTWCLIITLVFVFAPNTIATIFFHEPKAITIAVGYLIIIGFSEGFMCIELTTIGALSGLGMTRLCSIISIIFTGSRIPLAIFLKNTSLGLHGIWWAFSSTSIIKGIIFVCVFFWVTRKQTYETTM